MATCTSGREIKLGAVQFRLDPPSLAMSLTQHAHTGATQLDMSAYQPLTFDREAAAISSSASASSLALYGLGPGAYGTGRGNDPYAVAAIPKRPPPPPSSVSSQAHSFIQTPYQASLLHPPPVTGTGTGQQWPAMSVSNDELAQMGVPMPAVGEQESVASARGKRRALPPLPAGVPIQASFSPTSA